MADRENSGNELSAGSEESMDTQNNQDTGPSKGRRHFLKSYAVVAPIMMTVASRPVLGAHCTPSAWVSGNLSDNGSVRASCGGRSPGYWKTRSDWGGSGFYPGTCKDVVPGTCKMYKGDGTQFNGTFNVGNTYYDGKTLMQVLWLDGTADPYQFGAHIVAAVLNAATVPDYGMSVDQVVAMYNETIASGGIFTPSVGDPMTIEEVVMFIQNTFY